MQSDAVTVAAYLNELEPDRRSALDQVRAVVLKNLPHVYEENLNWGMITYEVPLATNPNTYNGKPLMFAAIASQKNYMAIYLCGLSCDEAAEVKFIEDWKKPA